MAYSLYLFIRDECDEDFVGFIEESLDSGAPFEECRDRLISKLTTVFGVGHKTATLALTDLLSGTNPNNKSWVDLGKTMIVIDGLVHNFLHRTGILDYYGLEHYPGVGCYKTGGCLEAFDKICDLITPHKPEYFQRFIQHSIWNYCSADGQNICNGNVINDNYRCENKNCKVYKYCARLQLH